MLTPTEYVDSLRKRADYFESAEGGWRDDTAALLREAADCFADMLTTLETAQTKCLATHATCRRVLDDAQSPAERIRNARESIVHAALFGVKGYVPGSHLADKATMLAALIQLHREEILTEGQVSRATRLDRVTVRHLADLFESVSPAPEPSHAV